MAYGSNIAGSFRLSGQQSTGGNITGNLSPQDVIQRGLGAEQELIGNLSQDALPEPPEGLQQVQGQTEAVHQKWAELKNFVNTMWNNYRIDVLRPDARNPMATRASESYKKAIADLRYSIDSLKQGAKRQQLFDTAVAQGMGTYTVDPTQQNLSQVAPEEAFYSTRNLEDIAQASNTAYARPFDTQSATRQAAQGVQKNADYLTRIQEALAAKGGAGAGKVEEIKKRLQGPIYEQPQFRPNYSEGDQVDPASVLDELKYIQKGLFNNDPTVKAWLKNQKGITDVTRTRNGARLVANGKTYQVNFNSPYGGLDIINEIRNDGQPTKHQLPTRNLLPFFARGGAQTGIPQDDMSQAQIDRIVDVAVNLYNDESDVSEESRQGIADRLQSSIEQGLLKTRDGKVISEVTFDKPGYFSSKKSPTVTFVVYGKGNEEDKEIVFDLNNQQQVKQFKEFLEENADNMVDWDALPKMEVQGDISGGSKFDVSKFIREKSAK